MEGKSGYILGRSSSSSSPSSTAWVSSPSDCSISGAGETGKAPGNAWDGDKMEALCLLRAMEGGLEEEFVEEVDQPMEERVEKKEPRKEGPAGGCGCGCGCG